MCKPKVTRQLISTGRQLLLFDKCVCVCVRAYVRTCVRAYVRTCVRAYVRTCVRACMRARVCVCV